MGVEPTRSAWKAEILPLNYTRTHNACLFYQSFHHMSNVFTDVWNNFFLKFSCGTLRRFQTMQKSIHPFKVERNGAEAVVAGDHGRSGIFHPAVVKVSFSAEEGEGEGGKRLPSALAKSFGFSVSVEEKHLPRPNIARVGNGVLVPFDEVVVPRPPHNSDLDFFQCFLLLHSVFSQHSRSHYRIKSGICKAASTKWPKNV